MLCSGSWKTGCEYDQNTLQTCMKYSQNKLKIAWKETKKDGSGSKALCILFQRTQIQFSAPTWWYTNTPNYSSRGCSTLFWPLQAPLGIHSCAAQTHMPATYSYTQNRVNKIYGLKRTMESGQRVIATGLTGFCMYSNRSPSGKDQGDLRCWVGCCCGGLCERSRAEGKEMEQRNNQGRTQITLMKQS